MQLLAAFACHPSLPAGDCWQEVVVLSCAGVGLATFFLKTKNMRAVLALFADVCSWAVCLRCIGWQRSLLSILCRQEVVILSCTDVGFATFFLKTKTCEQC
jgi:hypothetical protein